MIALAEDYVRVLIRRPHAYWFVDEHTKERGGVVGATPSGITLGDGSTAPVPGLYTLSEDGALLGTAELVSPAARFAVMELLEGSNP